MLPQGSDVAPVAAQARGWLDALGIADEVALHVAMNVGAQSSGRDWREDLHRPAIIIGTSEMLVSKALNRAFGVGPMMWPVDFALVTNGAHWVVAEPGRCPRAVATLQRVCALARELGTAEPLRLTLMSEPEPAVHAPGTRGAVCQADDVDLRALFGTSPEATAAWLDVVPLVTEAGRDLQVGVARATWTRGEDGAPDPEIRAPGAEYRVPLPLSAVAGLVARHSVWQRADYGAWTRVSSAAQVEPYSVLLVDAADDPAALNQGNVPELRAPAELAALAGVIAQPAPRPWQSMAEHSEQVRDQAAALVAVLDPALPDQARESAVVAGYLHDVGKAHPTWQDGLCALAPAQDQEMVAAGRPWAKSGDGAWGRLEFAGGVSFRHELASLLLIDGPLRHLLAAVPDPDLCRYLVLAHHGRLRVTVRDPGPGTALAGTATPDTAAADTVPPGTAPPAARVILGLEHGAVSSLPPILGQPATTLTVDLGQFGDEDGGAWSRAVAGLLEKYGPFRLAYLEALVRMADWRASAGRDLPR
jgi:CRISPR-associated endonuclease/helicase Cas3